MNTKWIGLIILLVVLVVGGLYIMNYNSMAQAPNPVNQNSSGTNSLGTDNSGTTNSSTDTSGEIPILTPEPIQSPNPSNINEVKNINVVGTEFSFTPSTITLNNGDSVSLTFKNNGTYPHNLSIPDLNIATKTIKPGEQDTIQFTVSKTGSFQYTCTIDSHAAQGMTGTLTVQ
jgi:plastocyanin